jgi:Tfp pilus assembly protein PilF
MADEGSNETLRRMPAEEFVRRLKMAAGQHDVHYAFWVGAGCSISAGIPGAGALVADRWLPRLQRVRGISDDGFEQWVDQAFSGYDPQDPAEMYGAVMEELFIQPEARQREVEALCDGRFPGFGYAVLAALLAREDGLFNVALTTNFDDLIADAMYVFTEARPLVIPDEALAAYIRPTRMRPLVIKVHGDHRLSPRNTQAETGTLRAGISQSIANLLHDRGVIFVGYGGNDQGIAELLNSLPGAALPLGVWWVSKKEPHGVLRKWLNSRDAIWVDSPGFEELMLLFRREFEIDHPTASKFDRLFASYLQTYKELEKRVDRIPDSDPAASSLKDAAMPADGEGSNWPDILLQAFRIEDEDPERAERLYLNAVERFPHAGTVQATYGGFLMGMGRFKEALIVAERAADIDPQDLQVQHLLGSALAIDGQLVESREVFEGAVRLAPLDAAVHAWYGLALIRTEEFDQAKEQKNIAVASSPTGWLDTSAVALLLSELGEESNARAFYLRAVEEAPENPNIHANLARCLIALGEVEQAQAEVQLALDLLSPAWVPTELEVLFYQFVIGGESDRLKALERIRQSIEAGGRSPTWDFRVVVNYGHDHEHPEVGWLESLAAVIGGEEDPQILDSWQLWQGVAHG